MVNVLIVDDQLVLRQLFTSFLKDSDTYTLAAALSSAEEAVTYCRHHTVDLILMDVVMLKGMNGLEASREIKKIRPQTKIIVVTSMPEVSYLDRAREIGIESFWYKEIQEQPILTVMDRTMAGEHVHPDTTPTLTLGNAKSVDLTPKELEVLREVTTGATDQEIADKLCISAATVRYHIKNLLQKTGYRSRTQLAVRARSEGLVIGEWIE